MNAVRRFATWARFGRWRSRRIREALILFPVIRRQLQETSLQVEQSVIGVCSSFTGIAARAREAVAQSAELLDGNVSGERATVESSIETSRRTIGALLERMERASSLSSLAVSSMEQVSRTVTGIEDLLNQVKRIAFTNKLVALNAKIEAVHVGELGSGFEVVADEISRQAEHSSGLADGIAGHINEMRERVDRVAADLREFLAEDRAKLEQSRHEAEGALSMLLSLHQRTRDSLEQAARQNSRLSSEIGAAVVGLQFQDRVKQRVEHVVEALESLEAAVAGRAMPAGGAGADLIHGLQSSYTMESERLAHHQAAGSTPTPTGSDPQEMEVELF